MSDSPAPAPPADRLGIPVGFPVSPGDIVLVVPVPIDAGPLIRADVGPVFLTRAEVVSPRGLVLSVRSGIPGRPTVIDWDRFSVHGIRPVIQLMAERFLLRGRQWWPTVMSFQYDLLGGILDDDESPKTLN